MPNDVGAMVKLIESLSLNSQDDTDPSNIVLQKFQSPTEQNQLGENVSLKKTVGPYTWLAGTQATFTRASITNNIDGKTVLPDMPRFVNTPAPFGKGLLVEEATVNYILNSDFVAIDSVTQALFSDTLQNNNTAWVTVAGAFTFGAAGATSCGSVSESRLEVGNNTWKPLAATIGGASVPLQFQATFKTTTNTSGCSILVMIDEYNYYECGISSGYFSIDDIIGDGPTGATSDTSLGSVAFSQLANTLYCITVSISTANVVTAKLYLTNTGGTLLGTLSGTGDLSQGFNFGLQCDTGIIASGSSLWGPVPLGWVCQNNAALSNVLGVGPAVSYVGSNSLQVTHNVQSATDNYVKSPIASFGSSLASTTWTLTFIASCTQEGDIALLGMLGPMASGGLGSPLGASILTFNVANVPQQFTIKGTFPAGETATSIIIKLRPPLLGGIMISYGGLQLENKAYATSHHRNDSVSLPSTRIAEALTVPTTGFSPTAGTVNMWVNVTANTQRQVPAIYPALFSILNAGGFDAFRVYHSQNTATWAVKVCNNAGTAIYTSTITDFSLGWHMFTVRWSAGACDLLVDGVVVVTVPSPVLSTAFSSTAYFGVYSDGLSYSLDSVMQDITVFTRSLTTLEVLAGFLTASPLFTDTTTVMKLPLNGDLNLTPQTSFNWNQGGIYS